MGANNSDWARDVLELDWFGKLFFFLLKLLIAYFIYSSFENGTFIIIAYILFCVGEQTSRNHSHIRALDNVIQVQNKHIDDFLAEKNKEIFEKLEELEDQLSDFDIRIIDIEEYFKPSDS